MLAITTPANDVQKLFNILEVQRPSGSQTEEDWVTNNLLSLEGARMDAYGNVFVEVSMDKSKTDVQLSHRHSAPQASCRLQK